MYRVIMSMNKGPGAAFLLAQVGGHAAHRFAERLVELDLTPPQAGLLRVVTHHPGQSQQALAKHLNTPATRLVALIDGLEARGLLERRRNRGDRRLYAVELTEQGQQLISGIGRIAREHDADMLGALDALERDQLHELLTRIVTEQGLTEGVHPGYRDLKTAETTRTTAVDTTENDPAADTPTAGDPG